LVRFAPATVASAKDAAHAQAQAIGVLYEYTIVQGLQLVQVPDGQVLIAVAAYKANPNVLNAEPDYLMPTADTIPQDSYFYQLWGLHNIAQTISGSQFPCSPPESCPDPGVDDADIDAPVAWDIWRGGQEFRIGVADTGVNYNHPDLKDNIWINPDEDINHNNQVDGTDTCPTPNGDFNCQDDPSGGGNGYIDDIVGYDFFGNDANPADSGGTHGTHVAGTIAAVGNNERGVVGVNWRAKIVPLRICLPDECSVAAAIEAIEYCVANDIRISNHSWGGPIFIPELYDAIQAAQLAGQGIGHLVIAAAHNTSDFPNRNNDVIPIYPASYGADDVRRGGVYVDGLDNVIAVAATDNNDALADYSHYGATHVHLGAPGTNILSTSQANTYAFKSGTSQATPHVTGVAALVWSRFPDWGWERVRNRILDTVRKPVASLTGKTITGGVVNAFRAVDADCNNNGIYDPCEIACGTPGGPCDVPGCGTRADCSGYENDCCMTHATGGCADAGIRACVCTYFCPSGCDDSRPYSYCCDTIWDQGCVDFAVSHCSASCPLTPDGIPDECQPHGDCNGNGIIDAAENLARPVADSTGFIDPGGASCVVGANCNPSCLRLSRNRFLSFRILPSAMGTPATQTAIRVTLVDLQHPIPPNLPGQAPPNMTTFDTRLNAVCENGSLPGHHCDTDADCPGGTCPTVDACTGDPACTNAAACTPPSNSCARWVGKPGTFYEHQGPPVSGPYKAARLQCTPLYRDWAGEGLICVTGADIVPSSTYDVQVFAASCDGIEGTCANVSCPLQIVTARWGDVEAPFNPPATSNQPDVTDVAQLVNKFKNLAGALVKAISQLQPGLPELNANINVLDILAVVDAFKNNIAYSFSGPCRCPSLVTCGLMGCANATPCVTANGPGSTCMKTCTGPGPLTGDLCIDDTHCVGSGTCGTGFCRDRCGRCSP